jgi:hypothetical protein
VGRNVLSGALLLVHDYYARAGRDDDAPAAADSRASKHVYALLTLCNLLAIVRLRH